MSFKARFYSFIYAENIDDHEHILVSFIPFANLLHVNQICWQNFISIVDNHAYWFVVVLSFVLSRYKELIKLSLKKNASPRLRDWKLVFTCDRVIVGVVCNQKCRETWSSENQTDGIRSRMLILLDSVPNNLIKTRMSESQAEVEE